MRSSRTPRRAWRSSAPGTGLLGGGVLGVLFAVAAVGAVFAQDDEEIRRHGIFVDSIEVSLVSLEVFATRDGEPVRDLTAADFEVLIDGESVEITSFSRTGPPAGAEGSAAEESPGVEPTGVESVGGGEGAEPSEAPAELDLAELDPAEVRPAAEPTTVLVVVDQLFLSPASRVQVFTALEAELDRLLEGGARVLVAAKTREEVRIEQGFTEDPRQVTSALERLADLAPPGYRTEIQTTIDLWDVAPRAADSRQTGPDQPTAAFRTSELDAQSAFQEARSVTERMYADVTASLRALHRFLDSLAGLPGRKALVYVADQLPVRPAEQLWRIWWQEYGVEHGARLGASPSGPPDLDATTQLEELIADATAARVAFYPIGADRGVDLSSATGRGAPTQTGALARATRSGAGDGLRWLSERTGGRGAVGPGAADGFFVDLASDLGSYYSLGFSSPHPGDGRPHRVEVRCRRPGVVLRHPTQYREKSADQRMTDRTLSTLTLGVEDNPLDVRVEVGKVKGDKVKGGGRGGRGPVTVPLTVHVPMANLVLLPDTKVHRGKLSIQLIARDNRGRVSDPVLVRMPLEVVHRDLAWALTQTVDYETELTLQNGGGTIAVGVQDDFGFTSSTVGVDVGEGGGS